MTEPIDPGELRTWVAYQEPVEVGRGSAGTPRMDHPDLWQGKAAIRPLSAKELAVAAGLKSTATHRVTIRWRPGVSMRGRFRVLGTSRILEITSLLNLEERNRWLICQAVENPKAT